MRTTRHVLPVYEMVIEKDVTELGKTFGHVLLRVGLLLVMSVVGSVIAGQGVRMYLASRSKQ